MNDLRKRAAQDRLTEGWPVAEIAEMYDLTVEQVREIEADPEIEPGQGIVPNAEAEAREAGLSLATIQSRDELPEALRERLDDAG